MDDNGFGSIQSPIGLVSENTGFIDPIGYKVFQFFFLIGWV